MPQYVEETLAGTIIKLPAQRGWPEAVHVFDVESLLAINAALATGRPLLVRGEPGTGKSQLARAAAVVLKRPLVAHAVDGQTETRDLLWTVDIVARLAEAQVMASLRQDERGKVQDLIHVSRFTRPGPLWWAFKWEDAKRQAQRAGVREPDRPAGWTDAQGVVVLIDEIDKADASVPNGLLDALGHGSFEAPGREIDDPVSMERSRSPLVVITTNEERSLPDAFLRRCLVLHLGLPSGRRELVSALVARGKAHFSKVRKSVLEKAAELLADDRAKLKAKDLAAPGLAEYLDMVNAVRQQRADEAEQVELLERISRFALRKHPPEPGDELAEPGEGEGSEQAR